MLICEWDIKPFDESVNLVNCKFESFLSFRAFSFLVDERIKLCENYHFVVVVSCKIGNRKMLIFFFCYHFTVKKTLRFLYTNNKC